MAKTKRDILKRTLAQAYINIDWAGKGLNEVNTVFKEQHPELSEIIEATMQGLVISLDAITAFAQRAWGHEEIDWTAWAATGRPRHVVSQNNDEYPEEDDNGE